MDTEFEQLKKALAAQVRTHRRRCGLSQEDLADRAGIDRTYVSQIERGVIVNPSLLVVCKVAQALDVPALDLLRDCAQG